MSAQHAWISGIGMMTPVGGCTAQTTASVRAGISLYQESSIYNKHFEPMTMALIPDDILPELKEEVASYPIFSSRQIRMLKLAQPALLEAIEALPEDQNMPIPLFLAGPETIPERPRSITDMFPNLLITQTEANLDKNISVLFPTGRAGGMQALQAALDYLDSGEQDFALIGGVDSYLDLYLLAILDRDNRVLASGIMDGFAPGEGAAFLLLCNDRARMALANKPTVRINRPGMAEETGHRHSDITYTGDGLAKAMTIALQAGDSTRVKTILSSMNGENMSAKEWGVAFARNSPSIDSDFRLEHPADCLGDTGAAIMPILAGIAAIGISKGYLPGPVLGCCSSEGPQRGAVFINSGSL